jgi:hypothetical protein
MRLASRLTSFQQGLMPTQGFGERTLNVSGFLCYLEQDDRFWSATTVYVPCGKADKLYYTDVKAICPVMTTLIHRTWLIMNGNLEYVLEGQGRHPCYQVYKHDKEYIQGETQGLNTAGMGSTKGPGGTFGATRTFSTGEAATKTNYFL